MGELRAALEDREAAADSVVAEVEPLERRQLREPLQRGQPDVDEAERLEAGVLLVEALDLRRTGVVQNQFLDLQTVDRHETYESGYECILQWTAVSKN